MIYEKRFDQNCRYNDVRIFCDFHFWKLSQFIDPKVKIEDVEKRMITSDESHEILDYDDEIVVTDIIGSDVILAVNGTIERKSFWP